MRLLLDTHILVWWRGSPAKLTEAHREAIADPSNEVFVSAASFWELAIKQAKGKIHLPDDFMASFDSLGFRILDISARHAWLTRELPHIHHDPFDRILISQAMSEGLTMVSVDSSLARYAVPLL